MHKVVNPAVNLDQPTEIDLIHAKRMKHATAQLLSILMSSEDPFTQAALNLFSVVILPGMRYGIDYPVAGRQVLEKELAEAKNRAMAGKKAGKAKK